MIGHLAAARYELAAKRARAAVNPHRRRHGLMRLWRALFARKG